MPGRPDMTRSTLLMASLVLFSCSPTPADGGATSNDDGAADAGVQASCASFETNGCTATAPDEVLYQEALARYTATQYNEAQQLFDQLWSTYPSSSRHAHAGYYRARTRFLLMDYPGTTAAAAALAQAHPTSSLLDQAAFWSGRAQYELRAFRVAIAEFQASLTYDPMGLYADNAAYYVARCHYELGAPTADPLALGDAIRTFELFLAEPRYLMSTYRFAASYFLGRSHFLLGDFTRALPAFQPPSAAANQYQDNAQYYIGRCHYELGSSLRAPAELRLAVAAFDAFLATPTFSASSYADAVQYYLGKSHFELADHAQALAAFDAVARQVPVSPYADNALYHGMWTALRVMPIDCPGALRHFGELSSRFSTSTVVPLARTRYQASACQAVSPVP